MQELLNILNNTKASLDDYYEIHKSEDFSNKRNSPKDYLEWIDKKTKIIMNSPEFIEKSKEYIVRGDVVWTGLKEALSALYTNIKIQKLNLTEKQLASKTYIELGKIYNFKAMKRWVNIFNINPISIERIDFTKKKGNVKGIDLDNISKAFLDSDLFKYRPSKNN